MPKSGKKRELMVERQKEPRVDTLWDHGIKDNTELLLESVLFGRDIPSTSREQAKDTVSDSGLDDVLDAELFFVDDNVANEIAEETTVGPSIRLSGDSQATDIVRNQRKSAWKDESDVGLAVSLTAKKQRRKLRETIEEDEVDGRDYEHRLRNKYEQMNPTPRWAADARKNLHTRKRRRASVSSTEETPPALFTSTSDALERRTSLLPHGILSIERLRDANQTSRTQGGVHSVEFHPNVNVPVLSTAGSDRRLRLFNIDGHINPHLQTVHVPSLPLTGATFHPSGSSILLTGPRPFYFIHDLQSGATTKSAPLIRGSDQMLDRSFEIRRFSAEGNLLAVAGRDGYINILDWNGGAQTVARLKTNAPVKSLWWDSVSTDFLWALTQDSSVYIWDLRSSRCLRTWTDDGGYGSRIISGDQHGKYLATGSQSGYVNIYDMHHLRSSSESQPKPLKSLGNLTTQISTLGFNSDCQMLFAASDSKKEQMRMVHLPFLDSLLQLAHSKHPLGIVKDVALSPDSRYITVANGQGCALLYRLHHFAS